MEQREAITLENHGEKIFAVLHRPVCSGQVPAIVICPGFGGNKCGKFRIFVTLAKQLTKLGIAVLRFDYRGAGDSEGEFNDITLEGKIQDTLQCLQFLVEDSQINSSRIGLLGRSLGGAIAILAARRMEMIKSIALWAPVFSSSPWQQLWESAKSNPQVDLSKQDIMRHLPIGIPNINFLTQFFALDLEQELQRINHIPLLHIHGKQDVTVRLEHAKGYEQARNGLLHTRFVQLPQSDHDFSHLEEQSIALQETCQWYEKTL